ncbi:MAG: extracellular solute-binding protein [Clostridia bacterium]|nr:extracellular solute-binding protein [Clostridia bacterium]
MRHMTFLRCLAAALALALLFAVTGCTGGERSAPETADSGETVTPETTAPETRDPVKIHAYDPDNEIRSRVYFDSVGDDNFAGLDLFITGPSVSRMDADGATYMSKELRERKTAVEKKLNVKINLTQAEPATMLDEATAAIASGMYYTDVMLLPLGEVGNFAASGTLMNLRSVPALDLTAPYFDAGSVRALSAGFETYGFASDACPVLTELPALYYNKDAVPDYGGESLREVALKGGLTWDVFLETLSAVRADLGEGEYSVGAGTLGKRLPETVHVSRGGSMISSGELVSPTVSFTPQTLTWSVNIMNGLLTDGSGLVSNANGSVRNFREGDLAFLFETVGEGSNLYGRGVSWSVLPVPRSSSSETYRSLASPDTPVFTVIRGTENAYDIGKTLSALSAWSYGVVPERYVDEVLMTRMSGNDAGDVLDVISKSAVYDLSTAFGPVSEALADGTYGFIRRAAESGDPETDYDAYVYEANLAMERLFTTSH